MVLVVNAAINLKALLVFFFIGCGLVAAAQGLHRYPMQSYTVGEGLSQASGYHILQDGRGYIWAGTGDGLNRLTPFSFEVFKHDFRDSNSLAANAVRGLVEDGEGNIWVGTDRGLNVFDRAENRISRYYKRHKLADAAATVPIGVWQGKLVYIGPKVVLKGWLVYPLVNLRITSWCCGNSAVSLALSAISKSSKSNPGATVQPTRA